MYAVCVTVWVKIGCEEDFVVATLANARATRREPDNVRFDVLRHTEEVGRFFLYEVYKDEAGFRAHQQTEHYLKWRETVADWMERKRDGQRHESIFPKTEADW